MLERAREAGKGLLHYPAFGASDAVLVASVIETQAEPAVTAARAR